MRTKKWALTFLVVFAGIILFTAQSAFGGCDVAQLEPLIVGNAPGTKLEGPITIFYQPVPVGETGLGGSWGASMYWFLRLRKGSQFYSFAGGPELVEFPTDLYDLVPGIIGEFFMDTVIPFLYPGCDDLENCPDVVLKSYDMAVDEDAPGVDGGLHFFVADVVIAVQD